MEIKTYSTAASFLEDNLSLLEREEAANNLILGIALGIREGSSVYEKAHFFGISKGRPVFCAIQTPPRNLLAYGDVKESPAAARLIFGQVVGAQIEVPGVIGLRAVAEPFAEAWSKLSGRSWEVKHGMGVFQLDEAVPPALANGKMRVAAPEDRELLYQWMCAFYQEAMGDPGEEFSGRLVEGHLKRKDLFLWEDPAPVSMAAATRPTRNGITINAVYTPPERRGRGYASNCVAQLSQKMLDSGYRFCSLFTNLANPTSNKIYQAIGYRRVGEFVEIKWA